jgi:hypothetical protein
MNKTLVAMILLSLSQILPQNACAKLDHASTQPLSVPMIDEGAEKKITSKDVEKIVPTDMQATDNMNQVAGRIADRGLQAWFNSPQVQGSALGQTAKTVQKNMATDITVKSNEPQAVEHKVSMQLMALQAAAKVQYSGLVNAVVNYDARAAQSMVELSEKVFNKDLFVNHTSSTHEDVSSIGIKWGW